MCKPEKEGQIGVINEIGDLGLGFEPISDEEAEIIKEQDIALIKP